MKGSDAKNTSDTTRQTLAVKVSHFVFLMFPAVHICFDP